METGCIELNSNFEGGTKNGGRSREVLGNSGIL